VGVVVAVVFRTFQRGEGGVFLLSVYSSAYLIGAELCSFLSASLESIDLSFFCSYLSVCVCVFMWILAEVCLRFSRGC